MGERPAIRTQNGFLSLTFRNANGEEQESVPGAMKDRDFVHATLNHSRRELWHAHYVGKEGYTAYKLLRVDITISD
jgi:hypothetical protein